jgi:hypothetical protein
MNQEEWLSESINRLSNNHVGIFAVDNKDPNTIYPLAMYPKERDLRIYFIKTSTRWSLLNSRYNAASR